MGMRLLNPKIDACQCVCDNVRDFIAQGIATVASVICHNPLGQL